MEDDINPIREELLLAFESNDVNKIENLFHKYFKDWILNNKNLISIDKKIVDLLACRKVSVSSNALDYFPVSHQKENKKFVVLR